MPPAIDHLRLGPFDSKGFFCIIDPLGSKDVLLFPSLPFRPISIPSFLPAIAIQIIVHKDSITAILFGLFNEERKGQSQDGGRLRPRDGGRGAREARTVDREGFTVQSRSEIRRS